MNEKDKIELLEQKVALLEQRDAEFQPTNDEIDLRELFSVIWAGRIKIITITAVFAIASVVYALSLPNIYKSEAILVPATEDSARGLGGLASQYGGLAAMAGINIGGSDGNKIEYAIELVKSWQFVEEFISKNNLKADMLAAKGWDTTHNEIIYDSGLYNSDTKQWLSDDEGSLEPTSYETFQAVQGMIFTKLDKNTDLLRISVEGKSPQVTYKVVQLLIDEINTHFREKDQENARKSIEFLKKKIKKTTNTEMRAIFYNLIENHTKTLMLTEVDSEYLIKTLVPAMLPEKKSKPRRAVKVILGTVLGGIFSVALVLVQCLLNKKKISKR